MSRSNSLLEIFLSARIFIAGGNGTRFADKNFLRIFFTPQSYRALLMWQPMFAFSASALFALTHSHISSLIPELATPADGYPLLVDMLLDFFKSSLCPLCH
jgi:hypothetical protein